MIELVTIGVELLEGSTVDTNGAYIGQRLLEQGWEIAQKTTVPDDPSILRETLSKALSRNNIVLTTGGLGPTFDDLTLAVAVELFETELEHNFEVEADLKERFGDNLPSAHNQSQVPKGAKIFLNQVGTAPCCVFEKDGKHLIVMPGVPPEMRNFMTEQVIPYLHGIIETEELLFYQSAYLFNLTESTVDPYLRSLNEDYPKLEMGIYPSYGTLGLTVRIKSKDENLAKENLQKAILEISEEFPSYTYSHDDRRIEMALHKEMISKGKTLSLAESCTGGMIAARLCQIPKASDYFLGGVVSYSNEMKEKLLQVSSLSRCGAVSQEVAQEMAEGVLRISGSDFAIAVTGVAGPDGGTLEKPVGTIWCAIAEKDKQTFTGKLLKRGRKSRESIIEYTGTYVMGSLWRYLCHGEAPFKEL
jgi:nicotinamide-nucleotide amidase